jgi:hypothetical protein
MTEYEQAGAMLLLAAFALVGAKLVVTDAAGKCRRWCRWVRQTLLYRGVTPPTPPPGFTVSGFVILSERFEEWEDTAEDANVLIRRLTAEDVAVEEIYALAGTERCEMLSYWNPLLRRWGGWRINWQARLADRAETPISAERARALLDPDKARAEFEETVEAVCREKGVDPAAWHDIWNRVRTIDPGD